MSALAPVPLPDDGVALLERALAYALGTVSGITREQLLHPTPCDGWDLDTLLLHLNDSLAVLQEAVESGSVELHPGAETTPGPMVGSLIPLFRTRASRLIASCADMAPERRTVVVGGCPMLTGIVTGTGAIEIAVHGWDIAQASDRSSPIPSGLATELLGIAPLAFAGVSRDGLFAAPVTVSSIAPPSDRLVAFLGRTPH